MQKIYFLDGRAVTKTQIIHDAEKKTLKTKSKNKRRLREGLVFRFVKDYKSWREFIGGCEQIGYASVPDINVTSIITRALESRGITEPCIAVFRLNGYSFVYSEKGKPFICNGKLRIERGGTWYPEEDMDGNVVGWRLGGIDADRTTKGEYLLTDKIDFPNEMSEKWQEYCHSRYGEVCDKYHIVPK